MQNRMACAAVLALFIQIFPGAETSASRLRTIYSFCHLSACLDGKQPVSRLMQDSAGNLFGTTTTGGAQEGGVVFELVPNARHTRWTYNVLHDFCASGDCSDGYSPIGDLIIDTAGNLYGTTISGGPNFQTGVAFELMPNARHTKWKFVLLHGFCSVGECEDGGDPGTGLSYGGKSTGAPYDGVSPLYGTTEIFGGTVYSLTPRADGSAWDLKTLYIFCSVGQCEDGGGDLSELVVDAQSNIFGTTTYGGTQDKGVVFEISGARKSGTVSETVLHSFCSEANCTDGAYPSGDLYLDELGNLFGTTAGGGIYPKRCDYDYLFGCGVVFKLVPNAGSSQETVLYAFCSKRDCADGEYPLAGLTPDRSGSFFGLTYSGGSGANGGVAFRLGGEAKTLYSFCSLDSCADGTKPQAPLLRDSAGTLYGTTYFGGASHAGSIFQLTP